MMSITRTVLGPRIAWNRAALLRKSDAARPHLEHVLSNYVPSVIIVGKCLVHGSTTRPLRAQPFPASCGFRDIRIRH